MITMTKEGLLAFADMTKSEQTLFVHAIEQAASPDANTEYPVHIGDDVPIMSASMLSASRRELIKKGVLIKTDRKHRYRICSMYIVGPCVPDKPMLYLHKIQGEDNECITMFGVTKNLESRTYQHRITCNDFGAKIVESASWDFSHIGGATHIESVLKSIAHKANTRSIVLPGAKTEAFDSDVFAVLKDVLDSCINIRSNSKSEISRHIAGALLSGRRNQ